MPLRERNKLEKLARIEKAARELLAKRGFEATTTRDIAARAGIGTGTLFLYFPEKGDVLLHLFQRDIGATLAEIWATLPAASLRVRLEHVFAGLYAYYARDLALSRVFIQQLQFLDPERRARVFTFTGDFLARIAAMARDAQHRGEIAARVDTAQLAYAAFGLYSFSLINWLGGILPDVDTARRQLAASLDLLFTGLTNPVEGAASSAPRRPSNERRRSGALHKEERR